VPSGAQVTDLLADLGPAERRHWKLFYRLAGRDTDEEALAARFQPGVTGIRGRPRPRPRYLSGGSRLTPHYPESARLGLNKQISARIPWTSGSTKILNR
jgi:hypothetical protein